MTVVFDNVLASASLVDMGCAVVWTRIQIHAELGGAT